MKKYYISALLLSLGVSLVTVSAQVVDTDTSTGGSSCVTINNNLSYKNRANNNKDDVMALQDFLNTKGYLNDSAVTGFFGKLTEKATAKFQKENGLLANPAGFVGSGTRAKILALSCNNQTNTNTGNTSSTLNESEILKNLSDNWETIQVAIPFRPNFHNLEQDAKKIWFQPSAVQFISSNFILVQFSDDNNSHVAVFNVKDTKINFLEVFKNRSNFSTSDWNKLITRYNGSLVSTYTIDLVRDGKIVRFNFLTKVPENVFVSDYVNTKVNNNQSSSNNPNLPQGCKSAEGYSPVTGVKCSTNVGVNNPPLDNSHKPVVYSVTPSTVSIGSTIDISGYFYDRPANCQTNGCIMAQHSDVSIKNSVGQSQVLLSGTLSGGNGEIIKLTIPASKPCVATPKGDCFPGAYVITPGQYSLTVTTDGVVSNSLALTVVSDVNSLASCKTEVDGMPVITSLSSISGPVGTVLKVNGCNLTGFEGDRDVHFEKEDGTKFLLTDTSGDFRSTGGKLIKVTVKEPCQKGETVYGAYSGIASVCNSPKITPGVYKVYTTPWNKKSNVVSFTVTDSPITVVGAVYNSVYIKDNGANGEFLFTDNDSKIRTVYYRGATFSEYSASTGKAQGTSGLLKTTLQDWLKIQKHIGDSDDLAGAPGIITIKGTFSDDHVLIASSITINGQ